MIFGLVTYFRRAAHDRILSPEKLNERLREDSPTAVH